MQRYLDGEGGDEGDENIDFGDDLEEVDEDDEDLLDQIYNEQKENSKFANKDEEELLGPLLGLAGGADKSKSGGASPTPRKSAYDNDSPGKTEELPQLRKSESAFAAAGNGNGSGKDFGVAKTESQEAMAFQSPAKSEADMEMEV